MAQAPARGARRCGSCAFYTSKEDDWNKECKLDRCACEIEVKTFGRAACKNYKGRTYIDTSNHGDIGGYPTGYCEWKCPPVLRKILWGEFANRYVNKDGSWCHCWQEVKVGPTIAGLRQLESAPPADPVLNGDGLAEAREEK